MNLSVEHVLLFALVVCAFYYINRVEGMAEDSCNNAFTSDDNLFSQQMQCYAQPGCKFVQLWDGNKCISEKNLQCGNVEANWADLSPTEQGLVCQQIGIANTSGDGWDRDTCAIKWATEGDQHNRCAPCTDGVCVRNFPGWWGEEL